MHIFEHTLWFEFENVFAVHFGVEVNFLKEAVHCLTLGYWVFAREESVLVRLNRKTRDGGVDAKCFSEDLSY